MLAIILHDDINSIDLLNIYCAKAYYKNISL